MSRWFRFYAEALDDPKVQRLPSELFKAWVNLLCVAAKNDGEIPSITYAAFALRLAEGKAGAIIASLAQKGLIDPVDGRYFAPHNWNARQFKSDVSNERVKRYRERKCNVTSNNNETPPDTEQIQSITEKKDARADARPVYTDSTHELWGEGTAILAQLGVPAKTIRPNIGRWLRDSKNDPVSVLGAIQRARDHRVIDPIPWITRAIQSKGIASGRPGSAENSLFAAGQRRIAELDEIIAREDEAARRSSESEDGLRLGDSVVRLLPERGSGVG